MDDGDRTIAAYDARMDAYLAAQRDPAEHVLVWIARFAALLPGPQVLELGSGPGADADRLEAHGLAVQRSDATPAFVERLRALGHEVLRLDVRRDPLPTALDGVFANAVLLHLDRDELAGALARVRDALVPGGVLACSLKEGDGEAWSERKLGLPRRFTFWREAPLRTALETAASRSSGSTASRAGSTTGSRCSPGTPDDAGRGPRRPASQRVEGCDPGRAAQRARGWAVV